MRYLWLGVIALAVTAWAASAQTTAPAGTIATVRITQSVLAGGKPLPAGTYELRLTDERPTPLPGQSADAQRRVEFVANGTVVARDVAEVMRDSDRPSVGASAQHSREGTRVDELRGGEFVRISVTRGTEQYLIYLPIVK